MPIVVPCVTADGAHTYREQMARVAPFTKRVHIDFSDGVFSPVRLINPIQAYWPEGISADLHLMVEYPEKHLETLVSLSPQTIIIHAESKGNLSAMVLQLKALGIKTGVALLQPTNPADARTLITEADHVMIFSGDLGHFGGQADMSLLKKVREIREINPVAEIGWDGGVNDESIAQLALGDIEVLNVGGAIQRAADPEAEYKTLVQKVSAVNRQQ